MKGAEATPRFFEIYTFTELYSFIVFCFVFLFFSDCGVEPPFITTTFWLNRIGKMWSQVGQRINELLIKTSLSKFMEFVKVL